LISIFIFFFVLFCLFFSWFQSLLFFFFFCFPFPFFFFFVDVVVVAFLRILSPLERENNSRCCRLLYREFVMLADAHSFTEPRTHLFIFFQFFFFYSTSKIAFLFFLYLYITFASSSFLPLLLLFFSEMTLNLVFNGISLHPFIPPIPKDMSSAETMRESCEQKGDDGDAEMRPILYSYSII